MKRLVLLSALLLGLSACTPALQKPALSDTPETAGTQETAEEASSAPSGSTVPESAVSMPESLQAMDLAVLPYDEIRLVYHFTQFDPPLSGYYTMSQNGRWGLMRNDGSMVLPCEFDQPIAMCSDSAPPTACLACLQRGCRRLFLDLCGAIPYHRRGRTHLPCRALRSRI